MSIADEFEDRVHCRADLERDAEARAFLEECTLRRLEANPEDCEALIALGDIRCAEGNFEQGRVQYLKAVQSSPQNIQAIMSAGMEYVRAQNFAVALRFTERARSEAPDNAAIATAHGICLLNCKRREEALDAFNAAIKLDPTYALAYHMIGGIQARDGNVDLGVSRLMDSVMYAHHNGQTRLKADAVTMIKDLQQQPSADLDKA